MAPYYIQVVLFLAALAGHAQAEESKVAVSVGGNGGTQRLAQTEDQKLIRIDSLGQKKVAESGVRDDEVHVRAMKPVGEHIATGGALVESVAEMGTRFQDCTCACKECQPLPEPTEFKSSVLQVMGVVPDHVIKCGLMDHDEGACVADISCQYNADGPSPSVQSRNPGSRFPRCHPTSQLLSNSEASIHKPKAGDPPPMAILEDCGVMGVAYWKCSAVHNDKLCDSFFAEASNNTMTSMDFFMTTVPKVEGGTCELSTAVACMAKAMKTEHCFFSLSTRCLSAVDGHSCNNMKKCEWDATGKRGLGVCNLHPIEIFSVFYSESHKLPYLRALRNCADMPICEAVSMKDAAPRTSLGSQLVGFLLVIAFVSTFR